MNPNGCPSASGGSNDLCGAVLVCGGGIAGIQASLDLSAAGFRVYLVEESPAVGGGMSRLDKTFPTGDCATCIISPKLVECMRDINIDVFTLSDVLRIEGEAGHFRVTVRRRPRYVDIHKCTACGDCAAVCPVNLPSTFDAGIGTRKAIDRVYAQAAPNAYVIRKNGRGMCSTGCPIDSSVQAYVALIAAGRIKEAADVIRRDNPLPSICGRVCFHPCESLCSRREIDEPINIRGLKRFAMDLFPESDKPNRTEPSGKSVAIIGSGPAGLAAAHSLALAGHHCIVYEALPVLGGMLAVGIPQYRLPRHILERDISAIRKLGVTFLPGSSVGKDIPREQIEKEFDVVFIATGAHESRKLGIPGEQCAGVVYGVEFLRRFSLNEGAEVGKRVMVVGGGNTAFDAARVARRLGAETVTILIRCRDEMIAAPEEIAGALAENIEIMAGATAIRVVSENGRMTGAQCIRMKLGERDASGRWEPAPIEGTEFFFEADMLIPAISQYADTRLAELFELEISELGTVVTDNITMATSKEGIFAAGDVVTGPSNVIEAIAQGTRAARAIDNYLSGRPLSDGLRLPEREANPLSKKDVARLKRTISRVPRVNTEELAPADRIGNFREVECTYTADEAQREARRCLNCAGCSECMLCVQACQAGAINHSESSHTFQLQAGAVLLTPGFEPFDATRRAEFGFGVAKNVVTNVQFERMLSASGPTGGRIFRPSDGNTPRRLAFIQCVGSRDTSCGNDYCSSVCCMAATKEAILAKEHEPALEVTVFFLDLRAFGKECDRYYERARNRGIRYIRSLVSRTYEMPDTKNILLTYIGSDLKQVEEEFDLVVLSVGLEASSSIRRQAEEWGVDLNEWGFARTRELAPLDSSRDGIYVGGVFQEPKDIPDTVVQASAAAARAMSLLAPARGSETRRKSYPPERDITDEPPRVGVFVCHCGSNIASVVDIEAVVGEARRLPHVVYADHNIYTCADDTQDKMKQIIRERGINRVVVASCTPRTHEPIFRDTLRDAGLNPYLLEMANIRDQCSWVHSGRPEKATEKAVDLVRMMVGRATQLLPLQEERVPVNNTALVVGGGIAGMTVALSLAEQGFPVHLIEKSEHLGGTALRVHRTLDGENVQTFLLQTIERVTTNPRITVHLNTRVSHVGGHVGEFRSILAIEGAEGEIEHGVIVVATGAVEMKPHTFGYGRHNRIVTQLELTENLANDSLILRADGTVVMIQCVEQRNAERPYCSRVCCTTAVKNALALRERYANLRIVVLYRDMRTYGFREAAYREAREKGILFIRYEPDNPPDVSASGDIRVRVQEPSLGSYLELRPDLLVLAAPMEPRADRQVIANLLRVPLNADGFFLEAHIKLRPVDVASEGVFLCGTAQAPKFISETISQANAVAARAASILSHKEMAVSGQVAWVDPDKCISCMTCVHVCPYMAPQINSFNKAEIRTAVCMGCGSCAAECPARAVQLRHYLDSQILGAVESLLRVASGEWDSSIDYLEEIGAAEPLRRNE
ncbi:MAG TPA: FAD-dependent oxidoreductase [bacterium]|mgnify:CR=1 FL=1|nr:FAD-dependent oxidoreductase [bacterium]HQL61581.1 FAD-dependent oxidoreductase [bacterium]